MSASPPSSAADIPVPIAAELKLVENILGTELLGTFCGLILYGIILHQFYRYCRTFSSDAMFIQALIIPVMILETLHTAMTMHFPYVFLVTNYAQPEALLHGTWSVNMLSLVAALITMSSQLFFIGRIYMTGITAILLFAEIALAIFVLQALFRDGLANIDKLKWTLGIGLLIPCIVDTILTVTLIIVLRRTRAGLKRNDGLVDLSFTYGVNTGLLHWALNWGAFLSFVSVGDPLSSQNFEAINIATSRMYAITFLCVLNSRQTKKAETIFGGGTYGLKVFEQANRWAAAETWNVPQLPDEEPASINIRVTTEFDNEPNWDGSKKNCGETTSSELDCTI